MEQSQVQEIKKKSTASVLFLFLRNIGIQSISTLGFFLLTILLGPSDVGLFAIVAESVSILGYFSDFGLASALIQQKDEIKKEELQTTFFIQQLIVIVLLLIVGFTLSKIINYRHFGSKEIWILISLCYSFFLASLKTIPSVLLERKLNFKLLSTIDVIENITFYFFAVLFAYLNFGAYSYAIATFLRSTIGIVIIYSQSPWPFGFNFSYKSAKNLFKFGIPYQLNTLIALAKDRLSNLLVASLIGREGFGILSWAQKGPRIPLSFMDSLIKVSFPTFSRLQDEKKLLKKSIEKVIFFTAFFTFPMLVGISIIAPDFINSLPKYSKWNPALVPLYFFCFNAAIASVTTPLTNLFNAVGKITTTTKFMVMWTILTWIFYPLLSIKYGYLGTSFAVCIVGLSSLIVWHVVNSSFNVNVYKTIFKPTITSLSLFFIPLVLIHTNLPSLVLIILKIIFSIVIYISLNLLISSKEIAWLKQQLLTLKSKV